MPDHVHLVLTPLIGASGEPFHLTAILAVMKGASARAVNHSLGRIGALWQDESFDHVLRSGESAAAKAEYICANPVRKRLCAREDDYPWLWREWIEGQKSL
jgi:hypothetical protein